MWRAQGCYLTIPARAEFLAKTLQTEELPQRLKMFRKARAGAVDFCCVEELAPGFVREQSDRAQFAAVFKMPKDFSGDVLLILCHCDTGSFRAVFHERFLRVRGLAMNEPHETNQLIPRLAMHVAIPTGINGGQFPFVLAGQRINGLRKSSGER